MYYYNAFAILIIGFVIILATALSRKAKPWQLMLSSICILLIAIGAWSNRLGNNYTLYNKIYCSARIEFAEGKALDLPAELDRNNYSYDHLGDAPIRVRKRDVSKLIRFSVYDKDNKFVARIILCRLKTRKGYPEWSYYTMGGIQYCFLADRFLYGNVAYTFDPRFAREIISSVTNEQK